MRLVQGLMLFSVQGRVLNGNIALYDLDSRHFASTHLYVGLTRATDGSNVAIA